MVPQLYSGVLQAINKMNELRDAEIFFNIEDEGVVKVLAQILTNILHNSLLHDNREVFYQDLLKVLEVGFRNIGWSRAIID